MPRGKLSFSNVIQTNRGVCVLHVLARLTTTTSRDCRAETRLRGYKANSGSNSLLFEAARKIERH